MGRWNDRGGLSHTRLYVIWVHMKSRCYDKNNSHYKFYGGRGIIICDEWFDFFVFHDWALQNGYQDNLEIDRIDVNGNYCPENCRFVTEREQVINRRITRLFVLGNETKCLKDWCKIFNIDYHVVLHRLKRGWTINVALTKPLRKQKHKKT